MNRFSLGLQLVVEVVDDEVVGAEDVAKVREFSGFIIEVVEVLHRRKICCQSWEVQLLNHWRMEGPDPDQYSLRQPICYSDIHLKFCVQPLPWLLLYSFL